MELTPSGTFAEYTNLDKMQWFYTAIRGFQVVGISGEWRQLRRGDDYVFLVPAGTFPELFCVDQPERERAPTPFAIGGFEVADISAAISFFRRLRIRLLSDLREEELTLLGSDFLAEGREEFCRPWAPGEKSTYILDPQDLIVEVTEDPSGVVYPEILDPLEDLRSIVQRALAESPSHDRRSFGMWGPSGVDVAGLRRFRGYFGAYITGIDRLFTFVDPADVHEAASLANQLFVATALNHSLDCTPERYVLRDLMLTLFNKVRSRGQDLRRLSYGNCYVFSGWDNPDDRITDDTRREIMSLWGDRLASPDSGRDVLRRWTREPATAGGGMT